MYVSRCIHCRHHFCNDPVLHTVSIALSTEWISTRTRARRDRHTSHSISPPPSPRPSRRGYDDKSFATNRPSPSLISSVRIIIIIAVGVVVVVIITIAAVLVGAVPPSLSPIPPARRPPMKSPPATPLDTPSRYALAISSSPISSGLPSPSSAREAVLLLPPVVILLGGRPLMRSSTPSISAKRSLRSTYHSGRFSSGQLRVGGDGA